MKSKGKKQKRKKQIRNYNSNQTNQPCSMHIFRRFKSVRICVSNLMRRVNCAVSSEHCDSILLVNSSES